MTENESSSQGNGANGRAVLLVAIAGVVVFLFWLSTRDGDPDPAVPPNRQGNSGETSGNGGEVAELTGKELYAQHCAACHGTDGNGSGVAATFLFPKPRDLRAGRFRLVSTANNVPTAEDLGDVLNRGMPGSSMPPWDHLSDRDRGELVKEVQRLRADGARQTYINVLKEEDELTDEELADPDVQAEINDYVTRFTTPGESSAVPEFTEADAEAIARGKELYVKQSCHSCHGMDGKGDGVQKQIDSEGYPTQPRDYTRGIFKGGHDPASLYRRIAYGMPGTPMPGAPTSTPAQRVDMVHFIRSMSDEKTRNAAVLKRRELVAKRVERIPGGDEGWVDVAGTSVQSIPLWWRNDSDPDLQVQAIHDGKTIAIRLSWRDESEDNHATRVESFEDAAAVELYRGDAEPFIGMGGPKSPVDIWFWDADRQTRRAVEETYPNTVVDRYPFSETVVSSTELNRDGARTSEQPDISLPARATGNPIVPIGNESGASSLTVGGPGSLTFRIPQSQLVDAQGQYRGDRWSVVMTRTLSVGSAGDGISLEPGSSASIAFAIWDGSQRDRDGKKLVTIWNDLEIEK